MMCEECGRNLRVQDAIEFALNAHEGQKDDNGKDYFEHLSHVVQILKKVTLDKDVIIAGYLHDTIEDTDTTYEDIEKEFGKRVADLVMEVTHEGKADNKGYYFPRLKTKEGIMIKFADRLSNLSRMQSWNEQRQEHYLRKSKFWRSE